MSSEQDAVLKSLEETKVDYRRLGNSGLRVSVPVLGAMSFGSKEWQPWVIEEEEVRRSAPTYGAEVTDRTA